MRSITVFGVLLAIVCCGAIAQEKQQVTPDDTTPDDANAKPIIVKLDWVEVDSNQCADLLQSFKGAVFADSSNQDLVDLKDSKHGRKLINHVQQIVPGSHSELTTQIDQKKFDLSLTVSHPEEGLYEVKLDASVQQGLLDSLRPIPQVKIPVTHFTTRIKLSHGKSYAISALTRRDSGTSQFLVVSLVEPWAKKDGSTSQ